MQIHRVNNFNTQNRTTNFKSVYPVYHWVERANGSVVPVVTKNEVEKLQSKLVRMLNNTLSRKNPTKAKITDNVIDIVSEEDKSYRNKHEARSYYNPNGGWKNNFFEALTYLITGGDIPEFDKEFGKPIGKAKSISRTPTGKYCSLELDCARDYYEKEGLAFVKKESKKFAKEDGVQTALHIVHTPVYYQKGDKAGKVKEYLPKWVLYRPESGVKNPFVKLGLVAQN